MKTALERIVVSPDSRITFQPLSPETLTLVCLGEIYPKVLWLVTRLWRCRLTRLFNGRGFHFCINFACYKTTLLSISQELKFLFCQTWATHELIRNVGPSPLIPILWSRAGILFDFYDPTWTLLAPLTIYSPAFVSFIFLRPIRG